MYNGFRGDAVRSYGATKLGVERFEGLVTRGVMIDLPALAGVEALPADFLVTADHIESALERQSMTIERGDAVLVRTGWSETFKTDPERYGGLQPGVGASAGLMLADRGICLLGADNVAVNPHDGFDGFANTSLDDPRNEVQVQPPRTVPAQPRDLPARAARPRGPGAGRGLRVPVLPGAAADQGRDRQPGESDRGLLSSR